MKKWTDRSWVLVLVLALVAPVWAEEDKDDDEDDKASPSASAAASTPAAAIEAAVDEYIALLKGKDYKGFVERMVPPDSEERKKPDWPKTADEMTKAYAGATPAEQAEMLDTFVSMKGKAWTVAPDGKTASLKLKVKDASGKEIEQDTTMSLAGGKWYMK